VTQRKLAMQAFGNAFSDDEGDDRDSARAGRSGEENRAARPGNAPPAKKRKTKLISDLDGKERDVALQEMKNGLKQKFGTMIVAPLSKPPQNNEKEYQTASSLYDTLKREVQASSPSTLQFSGHHRIVANKDINNRKRTKMVVDDMRKIVRVPFELANVQKSKIAKTNAYGISYPCSCLGYDTSTVVSAAPVATSTTSLKGTQGDLIRQARARLALNATGGQPEPEAAPTKVRRECGGRVYVITKDDNSHPLGIPGQKISVGVQHT